MNNEPAGNPLRQKYFLTGWFCVLLILFLACPAKTVEPALARSNIDAPSENEIKAIYLYNFLKFVKWPEHECNRSDGKPHQLAILGDAPFDEVLVALQEKLPEKDKDLRLVFYGPYTPDAQFDCCCLLFIAASESSNLPDILEKLAGRPVLTVADTEAFMNRGVMITLVAQENKVRWAVNRRPINESGLKLSAKLLDIAVKVIDE